MSISVKNSGGDWVQCAGNGTLYADAPLGTILAYGGTTPVTGWLLCQGQAISRTDYAELFAVIGTSFGAGDGSTTFNVPDLREATTKGVGLSGKSSNHYDSDGVALGEFVEDRVISHNHEVPNNNEQGYPYTHMTAIAGSDIGFGGNIFTGNTGSATNEVKAVGVNYIIKAKSIGIPADFQSKIDDAVSENVVDSVTDGDMRAVTSNAVYDAINNISLPVVDEVTDGEMRAVSSNAVYDAINNILKYSTSGRKVGTWIDGKPIYRMVDVSAGQGEISAGGWATCGIGIPQYVDNIIDGYLLDVGSSTYVFRNLMFRMNGTNLQFLSAGQGISAVKSGSTRMYVVEYTKTTD